MIPEKRHTLRGLTLVESLVAIGLITGMLLSVAFSSSYFTVSSYSAHRKQVAQSLLDSQIARFISRPQEIEGEAHSFQLKTDSAEFLGSVSSQKHTSDRLYLLNAEVRWRSNGKPQSIKKQLLVPEGL